MKRFKEFIIEASFLDPKYKVGHSIIFNKNTPPAWAPNLKNGDVLTIVKDDESIDTYGEGDFVKTLKLPDNKLVRVASTNRGGGNANLFIHAKKGKARPSGEDWESLIVAAYNESDLDDSDEGKRAKIFWADYGEDAKRLANEFKRVLKSTKLYQTGSSRVELNPNWRGTNKTPKTDILGDRNEKISLKKAPQSQLMSALPGEAISTFEAAMKMCGENKPELLTSFLNTLEDKMGRMSESGTINALKKLKDSGDTLTPAQEKAIEEMEQLTLNAKEITQDLQTIFKDMYFKSCFCFEAATGTHKFLEKDAIANTLIEFNDSQAVISNHLQMNNIEDARVLAAKNSFYVSFKTGGVNSRPALALRAGKTPKSKLLEITTFKDIIIQEISKHNLDKNFLIEGNQQQLNEFQLFNRLIRNVRDVSLKVKEQAKKILSSILRRIKETFDFIKTLGGRMFNAILNFLGMEISRVDIKSTGPFPLI